MKRVVCLLEGVRASIYIHATLELCSTTVSMPLLRDGKQDYIASPPLSCATGEGPGRAQAGGSELHELEPTGIGTR